MRSRPRDVDVPDGNKWCPQCGEVKPLADFPRNRSQRSGYTSYCKPCHNRITRENKEKHGGARNYHLRRRYGITAADFDEMFAVQGGLCAICREAPAEQVDHDHETKRVRGLLCFNCNPGSPPQTRSLRSVLVGWNGALGQFRDRTDLMERAIAYLRPADFAGLADNPSVSLTLSAYVGPSLAEHAAQVAG
jgi:hypothetical protein